MPQNSEQIEAKLCAYIDGELDAAGRAEIEKYLQNNPHHRALMAELAQHREVLAQLPRESAPPDILEAVQGQLERAVLLDGDEDAATGHALRMNIWPKLLATAAILLLAVGLGAVVVYVMPPMGGELGTYVIRQEEAGEAEPPQPAPSLPLARGEAEPPPHEAPTPAPREALSDAAVALTEQAPRDRSPIDLSPLVSRGGTVYDDPPIPPPSVTELRYWSTLLSPVDIGPLLDGPALDGLAGAPPRVDLLFGDSDRAGDRAGHALFMVVETDDPSRTNVELLNFFADNRIAWSQVTEPMPEPLKIRQQQIVTMSRLRQVEGRLRSMESDARQAPEDAERAPIGEDRSAQVLVKDDLPDGMTADVHADADQARPERGGGSGGGGRFGQRGFTEGPPQQQLPQRLAVQVREADNLIVARGMSMQQAEELQKSLYQPAAKQRVQVIEQAGQEDGRLLRQRQESHAYQPAPPAPADGPPPDRSWERRLSEPQLGLARPSAPMAEAADDALPPPATQPAAEHAPSFLADEPADFPHELPVEFDASDPADQVDVYFIILQNTLPDAGPAERDLSDTSERPRADEPASPPTEGPPGPAEPAAEPE